MTNSKIEHPKVVSRDARLAARKAHLADEKALTKARDKLAQERRELPWVKVDKDYVFEGPNGKETLADLFSGRSQLIVYHFMLTPGSDHLCGGCSFLSDHIDGANLHLAHHDVSLVVNSRAPLSQIEPVKKRMDWRFKWVSSNGSDFNYDYHVSSTEEQIEKGEAYYNYEKLERLSDAGEGPGISVFYQDENGDVFHTYSSYARGGDILIGAHNYLDLTPKGRNEASTMDWVRHHDRHDD